MVSKFVFTFLWALVISNCDGNWRKDAFQKEIEERREQTYKDLQNKISDLEFSMQKVTRNIDAINSQDKEIRDGLMENSKLLENLQKGYLSLEGQFKNYSDKLGDVSLIVHPDEEGDYFVFSNDTCGAVLVAQSGFISVNDVRMLDTENVRLTCMWSIQVNHRSQIRLKTHLMELPRIGSAFHVLEIFRRESLTSLERPSTSSIQTKVTRLSPVTEYVFQGPVIFLLLQVNFKRSSVSRVSLNPSLLTLTHDVIFKVNAQIEFEGIERKIFESTSFKHGQLQGAFKSLSSSEISSLFFEESESSHLNQFAIISRNFTARTKLKLDFEKQCQTGSALYVIKTIQNGVIPMNYCQSSGESEPLFLESSVEEPLLILAQRERGTDIPLRLSWLADNFDLAPQLNFHSRKSLVCGGVFSGPEGSFQYKKYRTYENGERCIWAILPEYKGNSSKLIITTTRIHQGASEAFYDNLYFIEFTDKDGNLLKEPRSSAGLHRSTSHEIFVVFNSDLSSPGTGFQVRWHVENNEGGAGNDGPFEINPYFNFQGGLSGSFEVSNPTEVFPQVKSYRIMIFTPFWNATYGWYNQTFSLEIGLNSTSNLDWEGSNRTLFAYSPSKHNGVLEPNKIERKENGSLIIRDADRMVVLILPQESMFNGEVNYEWKEEEASIPELGEGKCGGVISGTKGFIKYKLGQAFLSEERCIWLLNAPNCSSVSLRLRKDGFGSGGLHHFLQVDTIDYFNGTLRNETVTLAGDKRTHTFNDPVLVILLRVPKLLGDSRLSRTGFLLQFEAHPEEVPPPMEEEEDNRNNSTSLSETIFVEHYNNSRGHFSSESTLPTKRLLNVLAFDVSSSQGHHSDTQRTTISWQGGKFKAHKVGEPDCSMDTVRFYTTKEFISNSGSVWREGLSLPRKEKLENICGENGAEETSEEGNPNLKVTTPYPAFLVLYSMVPWEGEGQGETERRIEFNHKTAGPEPERTSEEISLYDDSYETEMLTDSEEFRRIFSRIASSGVGLERYMNSLLEHRLNHVIGRYRSG